MENKPIRNFALNVVNVVYPTADMKLLFNSECEPIVLLSVTQISLKQRKQSGKLIS
jgi:hypothetical protein